MQRAAKPSWNVYAKAPFAKGKHVLDYLGRYMLPKVDAVGIKTPTVAWRSVTDTTVTFRTRGKATKTLARAGRRSFVASFSTCVLSPDGFHKIRHVGL